jgi:hypothetical protein
MPFTLNGFGMLTLAKRLDFQRDAISLCLAKFLEQPQKWPGHFHARPIMPFVVAIRGSKSDSKGV